MPEKGYARLEAKGHRQECGTVLTASTHLNGGGEVSSSYVVQHIWEQNADKNRRTYPMTWRNDALDSINHIVHLGLPTAPRRVGFRGYVSADVVAKPC